MKVLGICLLKDFIEFYIDKVQRKKSSCSSCDDPLGSQLHMMPTVADRVVMIFHYAIAETQPKIAFPP